MVGTSQTGLGFHASGGTHAISSVWGCLLLPWRRVRLTLRTSTSWLWRAQGWRRMGLGGALQTEGCSLGGLWGAG